VAEEDGKAVGHVMFTRGLLDAPRRLVDVHMLSPLSVLPGHHGRGIGSALVRQGLDAIATQGAPLVFLEGSPAYYPRFGFAPGKALGFRKPSLRIPDDAFQVLPLPAYEPWMTGPLVYAEVFWRHDAVGLRDPAGTTPGPSDRGPRPPAPRTRVTPRGPASSGRARADPTSPDPEPQDLESRGPSPGVPRPEARVPSECRVPESRGPQS
jgi:putative acetyltransferase